MVIPKKTENLGHRTTDMNKRILLFFVFMAVFVSVFTVGSKMQVDESEAQVFLEKFNNLIDSLRERNFGLEIFSHNVSIALPMFLPGVGVGWGIFSAFSTGMAIAVLQIGNPLLSKIPSFAVLATPFGMMELAAYSIGMSRSFLLITQIMKKKLTRRDVKFVIIEVGLVIGFLLAGAFIEAQMIESATEVTKPKL